MNTLEIISVEKSLAVLNSFSRRKKPISLSIIGALGVLLFVVNTTISSSSSVYSSTVVPENSIAETNFMAVNEVLIEEPIGHEKRAMSPQEMFLVKRHAMVSSALIEEKVARLELLPINALLVLNRSIVLLFKKEVLQNINVPKHVLTFLTDTTDLDKLATALMEQVKFHIPASITLAQAAVETGYGKHVPNNNYFGIKGRKVSGSQYTWEYFTPEELKQFKGDIISVKQLYKNGKLLFKCRIRDHFKNFDSPWESFRAHSLVLSERKRYSPLFVNGKNYKEWALTIGSTKFGGVGYATAPEYGNTLISVIERNYLHLLDF